MLCCDHVSAAAGARSPLISFDTYQIDIGGDGATLVRSLLCVECTKQFNLSKSKPIAPEIWEREDKFPYICPACAQCLTEWQHLWVEKHNKPLVPTRNGEAPLLAAQRRRWNA